MSEVYGFSIEQLMELAGLSVAFAIGKEFPVTNIKPKQNIKKNKHILVVAGPGNNG